MHTDRHTRRQTGGITLPPQPRNADIRHKQEIRSVEHGYLSNCLKSTTRDLGHAPFGVIHRPLCSTSHGLSNKEKTKGLASSV